MIYSNEGRAPRLERITDLESFTLEQLREFIADNQANAFSIQQQLDEDLASEKPNPTWRARAASALRIKNWQLAEARKLEKKLAGQQLEQALEAQRQRRASDRAANHQAQLDAASERLRLKLEAQAAQVARDVDSNAKFVAAAKKRLAPEVLRSLWDEVAA